MTAFKLTFAILISAFSFVLTTAQDGQYDVRFNMVDYDCNTQDLLVDIEVKATEGNEFNITDQNYRFSFNREAVNAITPGIMGGNPNPNDHSVYISSEETLSGFATDSKGQASFFEAHTLTGTIDTIVSYNVRMAGGDGYFVSANNWTTVGRIRLAVADENACVNLIWHNQDPVNFPSTFIGEKADGNLYEAAEGNYSNLYTCVADLCAGSLPVEMTAFNVTEENCTAFLEWETATETNNDYFLVQRSFDGRTFETIASVQGNGTTTTASFYSFLDTDLQADNYYRLVQVDFDGTATTSEVRFVKGSCFETATEAGTTTLFPNPVQAGASINVKYFNASVAQDATILITDVSGRTLHTQAVNLDGGYTTTSINTDNLTAGTYFASVQVGNAATTQQFVVIQ